MKTSCILTRITVAALSAALLPIAAAQPPTLDEARQSLQVGAEASRADFSGMSFQQFKNSDRIFKEPFDNGKYIVNGDTPIADEKLLREFYEKNVVAQPSAPSAGSPEFAIYVVGGLQAVWSTAQKRALTYCISDGFGARYHQVVAQMENATSAWESVADLDFIHLMSEDGDCNASNNRVVFDVRPVQVFGRYLARAFFPNEPRAGRNVLIDESAFQLDPNQKLQLVGILRHELGHTIGARHEHTRPEAQACFEDDDWEPLTDYDPFSVMHYPQCNGLGDWSLTLTHKDKNGAACVYGPAAGFTIDPMVCNQARPGNARALSFTNESVARNDEKRYDTLQVKPGSTFKAAMSAPDDDNLDPGDPDLYVKIDGTPQVGIEYDCRPYLTGADEQCELDVPAGASIVRVMVHGYAKGNYNLAISYVEP